MISKARFLAVVMVTSTALTLACGGSDEPAPEQAGQDAPAAVPAAKDEKKPAALAGRHNPQLDGKLPANFPGDVPIYPEADIEFSRAAADLAVTVRMHTGDAPATVVARVSDDFAAQGWATETRETPQGTFIVADKLKRKAAISVTESEDGRTQIDVLVTEAPR